MLKKYIYIIGNARHTLQVFETLENFFKTFTELEKKDFKENIKDLKRVNDNMRIKSFDRYIGNYRITKALIK